MSQTHSHEILEHTHTHTHRIINFIFRKLTKLEKTDLTINRWLEKPVTKALKVLVEKKNRSHFH